MKATQTTKSVGTQLCDAMKDLLTAVTRMREKQLEILRQYSPPEVIRCRSVYFDLTAVPLASSVKISWQLDDHFDYDQRGSYLVGFREVGNFSRITLSQDSASRFNDGVKIVETAMSEGIEDHGLEQGTTYCYTFVGHEVSGGFFNRDNTYEYCQWVRFKARVGDQKSIATGFEAFFTEATELLNRASSLVVSENLLRQTEERVRELTRKSDADAVRMSELEANLTEATRSIGELNSVLHGREEELRAARKERETYAAPQHRNQDHAEALIGQSLHSLKILQAWDQVRDRIEERPEFQALPEEERQFFLERQRCEFFRSSSMNSSDELGSNGSNGRLSS